MELKYTLQRAIRIIVGIPIIIISMIYFPAVITALFDILKLRNQSIAISALIDITDKDSVGLQGSSIVDKYAHEQHIYDPIYLSVSEISDYHNVSSQFASLPKQSFITGNAIRRETQIHLFGQKVDTMIDNLYKRQSNKPRSHILEQIVKAANDLVDDYPNSQKILVVSSDLQSNSDTWSAFNVNDMALLESHPEQVAQLLLNGQKTRNYDGVTIIFFHAVRDYRDDILYTKLSAVYTSFFSKNHATVRFENIHY